MGVSNWKTTTLACFMKLSASSTSLELRSSLAPATIMIQLSPKIYLSLDER